MLPKKFAVIDTEVKSFKVQDFKDNTFSINVYPEKDQLTSSLQFEPIGQFVPTGKQALRIYRVEEYTFYYLSDGYLYMNQSGAFIKICSHLFSTSPEVVKILDNGSPSFLIFSNEYCCVNSGVEREVTLPFGKAYALFNGMLFIGNGRILKYSEPFDYTDFSVGLNLGGYFEVDYELGNILKLVPTTEYLIVLCERGIAKLSVFGERTDYSFKTVMTECFSVKQNSATAIKDKVAFISEDKLYVFSKGELKTLPFSLKKQGYTITGEASEIGNFYALPVTVSSLTGNYVYLKDVVSGTEFLVQSYGVLSSKDGIMVKTLTGEILNLVESSASSYRYFKSKNLDFNDQRVKRLKRISFETLSPVTVRISGDFGAEAFSFGNGTCDKELCLISKKFTVEFMATASDFKVENLCFYFTVKGE